MLLEQVLLDFAVAHCFAKKSRDIYGSEHVGLCPLFPCRGWEESGIILPSEVSMANKNLRIRFDKEFVLEIKLSLKLILTTLADPFAEQLHVWLDAGQEAFL